MAAGHELARQWIVASHSENGEEWVVLRGARDAGAAECAEDGGYELVPLAYTT